MAEMTGAWHVTARVGGAEAALAVAELLDEVAAAVSAFETRAGNGEPAEWLVEAYPKRRVVDAALQIRLALAAAAAGGTLLEISEGRLQDRDWLTENRRAFPPIRLGRFYIFGSHWRKPPPPGTIAVEIEAASAFGTGEHPSTAGCLLVFDRLARQRRFRRPLDIGTGSGILAIAASKRLRRRVLASDIDREAVRVARNHVRRNGLDGRVRVLHAPGYSSRAVRRSRYDLVFANILARPLALMARDLARAMRPGGRAILSGLLRRQEAFVLAAHRAQGLALERRLIIEGWSVLVLRSGQHRP
jgi:ribosomal protein L11 methyltransferase